MKYQKMICYIFLIYLISISLLIYNNCNSKNGENNICYPQKDSWIITLGSDWSYGGGFVKESNDGLYILGVTDYLTTEELDNNIWISKLDQNHNILWQKSFGGNSYEWQISYKNTFDGGFIITAMTNSFGVILHDYWVVKLDSSGSIIWQKTIGRDFYDEASSVIETNDGIIVAGSSVSLKGQLDLNGIMMINLDIDGKLKWSKIINQSTWSESTWSEYPQEIIESSDGGLIIVGKATYTLDCRDSVDDDEDECENNEFISNDYFLILKLDMNGNILWQKIIGGDEADYPRSVIETKDNSFIVVGYTDSYGEGETDIWLIKLDSNGNLLWQKTIGGSDSDYAYSIIETEDEGLIIYGETNSYGAGESDIWLIKVDINGNILWQNTVGGSKEELGGSVTEISDGGLIVTGNTKSLGDESSNSKVFITNLTGSGEGCDCNFIQNSNASVHNSDADIEDFHATIQDTPVTIQDSNAVVQDTDAVMNIICGE